MREAQQLSLMRRRESDQRNRLAIQTVPRATAPHHTHAQQATAHATGESTPRNDLSRSARQRSQKQPIWSEICDAVRPASTRRLSTPRSSTTVDAPPRSCESSRRRRVPSFRACLCGAFRRLSRCLSRARPGLRAHRCLCGWLSLVQLRALAALLAAASPARTSHACLLKLHSLRRVLSLWSSSCCAAAPRALAPCAASRVFRVRTASCLVAVRFVLRHATLPRNRTAVAAFYSAPESRLLRSLAELSDAAVLTEAKNNRFERILSSLHSQFRSLAEMAVASATPVHSCRWNDAGSWPLRCASAPIPRLFECAPVRIFFLYRQLAAPKIELSA